MIRGYFAGPRGSMRPYMIGRVTIASTDTPRDVHFLVDTGADVTILSARDAVALGFNPRSLPTSTMTGVGGVMGTALVPAEITLDGQTISITLRVLATSEPGQREAVQAIPSLLGRDVLAHFALHMDEHRALVLLLERHEADRLRLA